MKNIAMIILTLFLSISLTAVDPKNPYDKKFMNAFVPSVFIAWYTDLNRKITYNQELLKKIKKNWADCLEDKTIEKDRIQQQLNLLYVHRTLAQDKFKEIKMDLRESDYYKYLQVPCGQEVFFSEDYDSFCEGECFKKVHAVLQFIEIEQKLQSLQKKSSVIQQNELVKVQALARALLAKIIKD